MLFLENLNNIVSESNVIDSPFDVTISKVDDKSEVEDKIPNKKKITQNKFQNIFKPVRIKTTIRWKYLRPN